MKKLFLTMTIALLSSGAIYAQPASTETRVQRVVAVKNGNMSGILRTIRELLAGSSVLVTSSDNEHLILSGQKATVDGFEAIIKQLDVAPVAKKRTSRRPFTWWWPRRRLRGARLCPRNLSRWSSN